MARYVVRVEDETGGVSIFGTWRDPEKAQAVSQFISNHSRRYVGDLAEADLAVSLESIERWPGQRAWLADLLWEPPPAQ